MTNAPKRRRFNWSTSRERLPVLIPNVPDRAGVVYFVLCRGALKVGYTTDLKQRIKTLQDANPDRLQVLGAIPGTRAVETLIQERFGACWIHGEWFRADADLLTYAHGLISGTEPLPEPPSDVHQQAIRARRG